VFPQKVLQPLPLSRKEATREVLKVKELKEKPKARGLTEGKLPAKPF